jgi:hypothetical protein
LIISLRFIIKLLKVPGDYTDGKLQEIAAKGNTLFTMVSGAMRCGIELQMATPGTRGSGA